MSHHELQQQQHSMRNIFCFWVLGLINNYHFCIVIAAADQIAKLFHLESYVALILWANVFFGIFIRLLNTFVFTSVKYNNRFLLAGAQTIVGLLIISVAPLLRTSHNVLGFVFFLTGTVCIGNGSSYGESVALGYIERFPSKTVAGWSSGTGLSGVVATLSYMALTRFLHLSNSQIFLAATPFVLAYWAAYFIGIVPPPTAANGGQQEMEKMPVLMHEDSSGLRPSSSGASVQWADIKRIHKLTLWNNMNLAVVYVAEYAVQFMAPFAFPCVASRQSSKLLLQNSFVVSQLCYQFGVLCSRSSLLCIRIRRVSVLTFLQVLNAVMWFVQARTLALASSWGDAQPAQYSGSHEEAVEVRYGFLLMGWMFYVGLLGGASYANVFFNLLEMKELGGGDAAEEEDRSLAELQQKHRVERELSMNIGALYAACGIAVGSILDVLFTNIFVSRVCDDRFLQT